MEARWVLRGGASPYLELVTPLPIRAYFSTRYGTGFMNTLGINPFSFLEQVHGAEIILVEQPIQGELAGDGMVTRAKSIFLGVRVADCYPLYLVDAKKLALGLLHVGWRGSREGIVRKGVERMQEAFGSQPHHLYAFFGPGISKNHYAIGPDLIPLFPDFVEKREGKYYLDLLGFNWEVLRQSGVPEEQIYPPPYCTYRERKLFFSYRRDGGHKGFMWAILGLD